MRERPGTGVDRSKDNGQRITANLLLPQQVNKDFPSLPLHVTRDLLIELDRRMGIPGLGMAYVRAGYFVLDQEAP